MNKKSKKSRYAFSLEAGVRGFIVTCNKMEKEAKSEAYALLNSFADKLYGPEKVNIAFLQINSHVQKNWLQIIF